MPKQSGTNTVTTVRRLAATSATFATPLAGLAVAEHLAWGGDPFWLVHPPAGWHGPQIAADVAATAVVTLISLKAAKTVNTKIATHDSPGLVKRVGTRSKGLAE